MKNINDFIEATYLKTAEQAMITSLENDKIIDALLQDALIEKYKLVMILPNEVAKAKAFFATNKSKVMVGTVIDFPEGKGGFLQKMEEANYAIAQGADELDFVVDYTAFKSGFLQQVQTEIKECTHLALEKNKTVKWIIETAALTNKEIIQLTVLIKNTIIRNFNETDYSNIYVKSSTGFYQTNDNLPNGATPEAIVLMLDNVTPLHVKASGGIKKLSDVQFYISKGVKRIGTSSQKEINAEIKLLKDKG